MGVVKTNFTTAAYAIEASLGVLPGSPIWKLMEHNSVEEVGAKVSKVSRQPISKNRQRRKGIVTDLDSGFGFEHDLTMEALLDFVEGFVFARATGGLSAPQHIASGAGFQSLVVVNATDYGHSALTAAIPAGRLIYTRGFATGANNGLKLVAAASTTTVTKVAGGLVAESATQVQNAQLSVAGVQGATGDIQINGSGNLISTVLDFTTLGLTVGQFLKIGGTSATNQFATAAYNGTARVLAVTTNLITLDKRSWTVGAADNGATKDIHLYFGRFVRNVAVDHASFLERSFTFELALPGLQNPSGDMYIYPKGNMAAKWGFNLPLTAKALMTLSFIGTDTPVPTVTRATNAATPVLPVQTAAFSTATDIARLRLRDAGDADIGSYFKSLNVTIDNEVTPEKVLATLGAAFMNVGLFKVDIDAQLLFTDDDLVAAIRTNATVTMDWLMKNGDGGVLVDIPSLDLGDGTLDFPVNETVRVTEKCEAFQDATLGYSLGVSLFPFLP